MSVKANRRKRNPEFFTIVRGKMRLNTKGYRHLKGLVRELSIERAARAMGMDSTTTWRYATRRQEAVR